MRCSFFLESVASHNTINSAAQTSTVPSPGPRRTLSVLNALPTPHHTLSPISSKPHKISITTRLKNPSTNSFEAPRSELVHIYHCQAALIVFFPTILGFHLRRVPFRPPAPWASGCAPASALPIAMTTIALRPAWFNHRSRGTALSCNTSPNSHHERVPRNRCLQRHPHACRAKPLSLGRISAGTALSTPLFSVYCTFTLGLAPSHLLTCYKTRPYIPYPHKMSSLSRPLA